MTEIPTYVGEAGPRRYVRCKCGHVYVLTSGHTEEACIWLRCRTPEAGDRGR
jgi:hypothetical protein